MLGKAFFFILSTLFLSQINAGEISIEYKIKAGYLYNFTKFITWPEDDLNTFNICIIGKDPFGDIIDPIEARKVKKKQIRLYRISLGQNLDHCHIIYSVNSAGADTFSSKSLTITSAVPKLTVREESQFSQKGGMIFFFLKNGKIKLRINLKSLRSSGLTISAKLLEVAEIYEESF